MKNEENFILKKDSKIYKFYHKLNKNPFTSWLVPKNEYTEELNCFNNLCSFLRTNIFLTIYIGFFFISFLYLIFNLNATFNSLQDSSNFFLIYSVVFKFIFLIIFLFVLVLCSLVFISKNISNFVLKLYNKIPKEEKEYVEKKPNLFLQMIKDKHNKICRTFKIEK